MIEQSSLELLKVNEYILPEYQIIQHVRRGNYYDVYQVWSKERMCGCIGKVIRPDCVDHDDVIENLIREGEILAKLSHPNLVKVYEIPNVITPVLIEESIIGVTLYQLLENLNMKSFTIDEIANFGLQLCSVVQYLHKNNILHLDLNTTNIINQPPYVKLIDFGTARTPGKYKKGIGSRQFMAPEQANGELLTEATDIWGIGAILYNVITKKVPFKALEGERYDQLERKADSLQRLDNIPQSLTKLIDCCLEVNPMDRPPILQMIKEFQKYV